MLRAAALGAVSFFAFCCAACTTPRERAVDLDAAIQTARDVQLKQGPRASIAPFEQALAAAREQQSRTHEGLILGHLGTAYKNLGHYERATQYHRQSLAIKREVGDELEIGKTLSNLGLVSEAQGDCAGALSLYEQSLTIFRRVGASRFEASVLNNQGLCYDTLGDYRRSTEVYQRALALHREHGNATGESETLGNLGGVDLLLGRYAQAAERYEAALAISTRLDARQSMVLDLINLGLARLGTGELTAASGHLTRARTLAREAGLLREEADAARGVSEWLHQIGRYDEARRALDEAVQAYERAGLARERVDARYVLGTLDLEIGHLARAAAAFEKAASEASTLGYHAGQLNARLALAQLELRRHNREAAVRAAVAAQEAASKVGDAASAVTARTWLARVRLAQGEILGAGMLALEAVQKAEAARSPVLEAEARLTLGDVQILTRQLPEALGQFDRVLADEAATQIPDLVWRAAFGRGRVLDAQGRHEAALREYLRAVDVVERVRGGLASDRDRTGYLDDKRDVYAALVRVLLRLGRVEAAFQAAERLRAQGYRELLERSLRQAAGQAVPERALLARLQHLRTSLEAELRRPAREQRGEAIASYRAELHASEEQWAAVERDPGDAPAWTRDLRLRPPPAEDAVRRRLPAGAALVEYFLDREHTVAFVLTRTAVRAIELPVGAEQLRARIELLRGLLARKEGDLWKPVAERLDADLLAPLRGRRWLHGVSRLYIVPHAHLNDLPFAVLRQRQNGRLLVDDLAPVMLPSAAALVEPVGRGEAAGGLLALAPERPRLPYARQEVESVASLFPASRAVFVGPEATERRFKQQSGNYRVLHLATHGFFNRFNPMLSGIELESGGDEDGRLQVFEILGLPLRADLVTLSACDTALGAGELGDSPAGDALLGLTRAFLSAGSRRVVATLWQVNDRATASLMTGFYETARTRPHPEALAAVQRARTRGAHPEAHPWYWAAFVLAEGRAGSAETVKTGP